MLAAQEAVWLDCRFLPNVPAATTGQAVFIDAPVHTNTLARAIFHAIGEADALRARFGLTGATVRQVVQPATPVDLPCIDFTDAADPLAEARAWMAQAICHVFAWDSYPLYRFALLRLGPSRSIWFQSFSHLIIDATGRKLLTRRVAEWYGALQAGTVPAPNRAADLAEARSAELAACAAQPNRILRQYWRTRLAGLPEPLIDADRRRSDRAVTGRPARQRIVLPASAFDAARAAARSVGASAASLALALVHAAFGRLYERWDLISLIPVDNRLGARLQGTVGMLAQTMPFRLALSRTLTLGEAVARTHKSIRPDYRHRRIALHEIHADLEAAERRRPVFDLEVSYLQTAYDFDFAGAALRVENLSYGFGPPWMVTFVDAGPGRDVEVTIDTDAGLVPAGDSERMAECLRALFDSAAGSFGEALGMLPVMDAGSAARERGLSAPDTVALPEGATLVSLLEDQARRTPTATAVIFGADSIDYATLHRRADRLARALLALGVANGGSVGIALPRTPDLLVAVLAVHKVGAAYVPLDPAYPAERLAWIMDDASLGLVLTLESLAQLFASRPVRVLRLDAAGDMPEWSGPANPPPRPEDLAYAIYTSGSTGLPKPAGIEHRNVVNLICWARSVLTDEELSGVLFSTSLNFDLSVFEMFLPLAFGGRVVLVDKLLSLPSAPAADEVRLVNTNPSLLAALLGIRGVPETVRAVIVAGERLSRELADRLFASVPAVRLLNLYGPTETTVYSTWTQVRREDTGLPSIGRGIWNTPLAVRDPGMQPLPPGAVGELWIGGAGVGRGYLGRPELTAERFCPNPFGTGRFYRTGDRVHWRPDGELAFVGRVDDQLKIHGLRIEPGEIEAALRQEPSVASAAVVLHREASGTARLIAWYTARPGAADVAASTLRGGLAQKLPPHMVPAQIHRLEAMPLTPNGKLDRQALAALAPEDEAQSESRLPVTPLEQMVAAIWRDILGRDTIPAEVDFFRLGGDSLAVIAMVVQIEAQFGVPIRAEQLADDVTVARLASHISTGFRAPDAAGLVVLQSEGDGVPLFCVPGLGGDPLHLRTLARQFQGERPFLALRRGLAAGAVANSIESIATRFVEIVVARQPEGQILLAGYSAGGAIAYELARQLTARGRDVAMLAVIDTRRPGWRPTLRKFPAIAFNFLRNLPIWMAEDLTSASWTQIWHGFRRAFYHLARLNKDPDRMVDMQRYWPALQHAIRHNFHALQNYVPQPWHGSVTILRCHCQPVLLMQEDSALGWRALARSVRVRPVPGNHFSVMREPLVAQLAAELRAAIAETGVA